MAHYYLTKLEANSYNQDQNHVQVITTRVHTTSVIGGTHSGVTKCPADPAVNCVGWGGGGLAGAGGGGGGLAGAGGPRGGGGGGGGGGGATDNVTPLHTTTVEVVIYLYIKQMPLVAATKGAFVMNLYSSLAVYMTPPQLSWLYIRRGRWFFGVLNFSRFLHVSVC